MDRKEYRKRWLKTPRGLYYTQKCRAKQRDIEFKLSFEEWLDIWGDKLSLRGRNLGQLCMCRCGDTGSYEVGNVYIDTMTHNSVTADGRKKRTNAKLTKHDIPKIKEYIEKGMPPKAIGKMFGVSRQAINDIQARRTWREL
jgi:hypothetical protein